MWQELISIWRSDNLLAEAWRESFDMLNITHEMFLEAVRVLREEDATSVKNKIRKIKRHLKLVLRKQRKLERADPMKLARRAKAGKKPRTAKDDLLDQNSLERIQKQGY